MTKFRFLSLAVVVAVGSFLGGAVATLLLPERLDVAEMQTVIAAQKKVLAQMKDLVKACLAKPGTSAEVKRRPPVSGPPLKKIAPATSPDRDAARRAAEDKRRQIVTWLAKAHEAVKAKRYEDAREFYRQVLHLEANHRAAEAGLARLEARQKIDSLLREAETALKQKSFNRAIKIYATVLSLQPDHAGAKAGLAGAEKAKAERVTSLLSRAQEALAEGKRDLARKLYGEVLSLDQDNALAKAGLTRVKSVSKPSSPNRPDN
ncbi:MAG: hypothetical protein KJ621_11065 [Proteobacteria bacterium]|nr:hypothetical protein [Pseudomonadota bacterium]